MKPSLLILTACFLLASIHVVAQADVFSGSWSMHYTGDGNSSPIYIELQIGTSERDILYPAHLKLQYEDFSADYQLLLVRKNIRQLAISKIKYPEYERPFRLKDWPVYLNGVFDLSKNNKGEFRLTINRLQLKRASDDRTDTAGIRKEEILKAFRLRNLLISGNIVLDKINNDTWLDENRDHILDPHLSKAYFGLQDTFYVQQYDGTFDLLTDKKKAGDIISARLNGHSLIDLYWLSTRKYTQDIILDTGLNIVAFFADELGGHLPGRGMMNMRFGATRLGLDFPDKADSAASFIAARIYYDYDKTKNRNFEEYLPAQKDTLQKNDRLIGSLRSTSRQLTFAVWDDAVEDGDTISINVNGVWAAHYFPVKKKTQYITITLQPGPNTITYTAENLGSIPPNTSIIEIIDGNKRKAYSVATLVGENNLLKIFYDVQP